MCLWQLTSSFFSNDKLPLEWYSTQGTYKFPQATCESSTTNMKQTPQNLMKKPKLFIIHLVNESHNAVLENLGRTTINCPDRIDLGLYDTNNVLLFFLDDDDCRNNVAILTSIFSMEEARHHHFLAAFQSPCLKVKDDDKPYSTNALIMHRHNYYDNKIHTMTVKINGVSMTLENLFPAFPMNVRPLLLTD